MSSKSNGKVFYGVVISAGKMQDTIVVEVERRESHPIYGKTITRRTKLHVHAPNSDAKVGDKVMVRETRPISKTKFSVLEQILESAS